jgi:hypothetical protein
MANASITGATELRGITQAIAVAGVCPICRVRKITHASSAGGVFALRCGSCIGRNEPQRSDEVRKSIAEARARLRPPGSDLAALSTDPRGLQ